MEGEDNMSDSKTMSYICPVELEGTPKNTWQLIRRANSWLREILIEDESSSSVINPYVPSIEEVWTITKNLPSLSKLISEERDNE